MTATDFPQFLAARGVRITSDPRPTPEHVRNWPVGHSWAVTLTYKGRRLATPFHQGSGHGGKAPTAAAVLSCLLSDAASTVESFPDWCASLGENSDSRKAEATYRACQRGAAKLARFLREDLEAFQEAAQGY